MPIVLSITIYCFIKCFFTDQGQGRWKIINREKLEHDITNLKKMTGKMKV